MGEEAEAWGGRLEWDHDVRLCLKLGWGFGLDRGTVACAFQPVSVLGPKKGDKNKLNELVKILGRPVDGRPIHPHSQDGSIVQRQEIISQNAA